MRLTAAAIALLVLCLPATGCVYSTSENPSIKSSNPLSDDKPMTGRKPSGEPLSENNKTTTDGTIPQSGSEGMTPDSSAQPQNQQGQGDQVADKPGLEWCDGKDNDGDSLADEDQKGDKTFCDRKALQSPSGYAFKHQQTYYLNAFKTRWDQDKNNWKATATTSRHCKIVDGKSVHAQEPYNLQRIMKALLTLYRATGNQAWLNEAIEIADLMIAAAVPFDPNSDFVNKLADNNKAAWTAWLASLPTWTVNGKEVKLLYWDTSQCATNASNHPAGYYRLMEAEFQGLRGISELARILSVVDPPKAQKYYNYAAQVIGFYPMGFGGNPLPALDPAADKLAHFIMNAYDLYVAGKDKRFLDWAAAVNDTLLDQKTGTFIDQGDFLGLLWVAGVTFEQGDPYRNPGDPQLGNKSVMDTSHANRMAELVRYWREEEATPFAKGLLPKAVNTFLFKIWQTDPQTKIGEALPYPTLFRNYPDGSNPCSDPGYSPYAFGNVTFGWNELARYDRRLLFVMEALTDSLIEGTYVNDFSAIKACNATGSFSVNGTANPGLSLNAIAEMAFATRLPSP